VSPVALTGGCKCRHRPRRAALIDILAVLAVATAGSAAAQTAPLRDPTRPPPEWGATPGVARDPAAGFRPDHLVIIDGQRHLMWQGRRYRVGDSVAGARIERIDETEVWLRTPEGMRKLQVFAGIDKRTPAGGATTTTSEGTDAMKGQTR